MVVEDTTLKSATDFLLLGMGDIVHGLFLQVDINRFDRADFFLGAERIASIDHDTFITSNGYLGNQLKFFEESISKIGLYFTSHFIRVVYRGYGSEHVKIFSLQEILPIPEREKEGNTIRTLTTTSYSSLFRKVSIQYGRSELKYSTEDSTKELFEYVLPVKKVEKDSGVCSYTYSFPSGPYVVEDVYLETFSFHFGDRVLDLEYGIGNVILTKTHRKSVVKEFDENIRDLTGYKTSSSSEVKRLWKRFQVTPLYSETERYRILLNRCIYTSVEVQVTIYEPERQDRHQCPPSLIASLRKADSIGCTTLLEDLEMKDYTEVVPI